MIPWEFHRYTSLPTVYKHSFFSSASITFVIFYILVLAIQTGKRWYLLCFWSAFPLITSDAEHLVIYLLIIYMPYLWENVYSLKMEHTLCLLYSNIRNSVVDLYINNELSDSGMKKTIPFTITSKKDETLRNTKARCWKILCKTFNTLIREILKELNICKVTLSIQCDSWGRICISINFPLRTAFVASSRF